MLHFAALAGRGSLAPAPARGYLCAPSPAMGLAVNSIDVVPNETNDLFRTSVRRFIEREVKPHHAQWENDGMVSRAEWDAFAHSVADEARLYSERELLT